MIGFFHAATFTSSVVNTSGGNFISASGTGPDNFKAMALEDAYFSEWGTIPIVPRINVTQSSPTHNNFQKLFTLEPTPPEDATAIAILPYVDDGGNPSTLLYSFEDTGSLIRDSYRIPYPQIGATSSLGTASFGGSLTDTAIALSNVGGFIYYWDGTRDIIFSV
jgi:hypothetical protein